MAEQLIPVAFGALIGLISGVLGRVIYDSIVKSYKKEAILNGIISEIKGIKFDYLLNIYLIYSRYALLTREKIDWLRKNLVEYQKVENIDNIISGLTQVISLNDAEFGMRLEQNRLQGEGKSLIPKKSRIIFIEQNLNHFDLFDEIFQYKILRITKAVDRLNQQIDMAKIYDMKTFEVEDDENHKRICQNLDIALQSLGRFEERAVNDITEFVTNYEKIDNVKGFN